MIVFLILLLDQINGDEMMTIIWVFLNRLFRNSCNLPIYLFVVDFIIVKTAGKTCRTQYNQGNIT